MNNFSFINNSNFSKFIVWFAEFADHKYLFYITLQKVLAHLKIVKLSKKNDILYILLVSNLRKRKKKIFFPIWNNDRTLSKKHVESSKDRRCWSQKAWPLCKAQHWKDSFKLSSVALLSRLWSISWQVIWSKKNSFLCRIQICNYKMLFIFSF